MKTIEELARECIAEDWDDHLPGYYRNMNIERFAALVRAEALEEACKIIWGQCSSDTEAQRTVDAIRKAKEKT
jgi:hypothetical protein